MQQQLKSLSSDEKMPMEDKINMRNELQQQLQDLKKQMSQRKMEIQQEKRDSQAAKAKSQESAQANAGKFESSGMEPTSMQSIISADASMKQGKMLHSVKTSMEGKSDVLKCEIKLDKARGASTERKEAELSTLMGHVNETSADMMRKISDANKTLEKSGKENKKEDAEINDVTEDINHGNSLAGTDGKTLSNPEEGKIKIGI